jgi:hypothetical protein
VAANGNGRSSRVLGLLLPVLERAGPAVSLVILLLGAALVHFLLGELRAQQETTRELVERLLRCTQELGRLKPPPP